MIARLALGTVQFGLPYGIANRSGQISRADAAHILEHAAAAGLDTLDTAIGYGDSEQRLGEIGVGRWRVVSKLPAAAQSCADIAGWVRQSVHGTLSRLRVTRLHGLLLHSPGQLAGPLGDALYRALAALRDEGSVTKIGISVYGPDELDALWPKYPLDMVQAPFNVVDRRLAASGWLSRLQDAGAEVHVRSIFLQGLLLMSAGERPAAFSRWISLWQSWHGWLRDTGITPLQACLGFALSHEQIDRVVVGVDSLEQLQQILAGSAAPRVVPPHALACEDPDLINPSRWSRP